MTRLLPEPHAIHDVRDIENLVRRILHDETRAWNITLNQDEHDRTLGHLIGIAYELGERYDPTRARTDPTTGSQSNFSAWAYRILRYRARDILAQRKRDRTSLSLNAPTAGAIDRAGSPQDTAQPELGDALPSLTGNPSDDRSPDLARVLRQRSRQNTALLPWSGAAPPRRTS